MESLIETLNDRNIELKELLRQSKDTVAELEERNAHLKKLLDEKSMRAMSKRRPKSLEDAKLSAWYWHMVVPPERRVFVPETSSTVNYSGHRELLAIVDFLLDEIEKRDEQAP